MAKNRRVKFLRAKNCAHDGARFERLQTHPKLLRSIAEHQFTSERWLSRHVPPSAAAHNHQKFGGRVEKKPEGRLR
jgi:hypothetical protein